MGEYLQQQYFLREEKKEMNEDIEVPFSWIILQGIICLLKLKISSLKEEPEFLYCKSTIMLLEEAAKQLNEKGF